MSKLSISIQRRLFLAGVASLTGSVAFAQNVGLPSDLEQKKVVLGVSRRNISSFRMLDWRPYFKSLRNGAILSEIGRAHV